MYGRYIYSPTSTIKINQLYSKYTVHGWYGNEKFSLQDHHGRFFVWIASPTGETSWFSQNFQAAFRPPTKKSGNTRMFIFNNVDGGFNPSKTCASKWDSSPNRGLKYKKTHTQATGVSTQATGVRASSHGFVNAEFVSLVHIRHVLPRIQWLKWPINYLRTEMRLLNHTPSWQCRFFGRC